MIFINKKSVRADRLFYIKVLLNIVNFSFILVYYKELLRAQVYN